MPTKPINRKKTTKPQPLSIDTVEVWDICNVSGGQRPRILSLKHAELEGLRASVLKHVEKQSRRCERYVKDFTLSPSLLQQLAAAFHDEILRGLVAHVGSPNQWDPQTCSMKMLDTCLGNIPEAFNDGIAYALDFGGTNFRVVRAAFFDGDVSLKQEKYSLIDASFRPKGLLDADTAATEMFDFFANSLRQFMEAQGDFNPATDQSSDRPASGHSISEASDGCSDVRSCIFPLGLTFSFPSFQENLTSSVLVEWTKGFETGRHTEDPVEGQDVGKLLQASLMRHNLPCNFVAVLNDTVGALISGVLEAKRANQPPVKVGLIVGTGINACYFESAAQHYGYVGKVINLECGNFDRDLPLTQVDYEIDFVDRTNRSRQLLEKMISGAYIGEIARRVIIRVLQHRAPSAAWVPGTLSAERLIAITDDRSPELSASSRILSSIWCVKSGLQEEEADNLHLRPGEYLSDEDVRHIRQIALAVVDRAAALASVIVSGIAMRMQDGCSAGDYPRFTVAVDGSLYKHAPHFRNRLCEHVLDILGPQALENINFMVSDDGSGKGAALVAAGHIGDTPQIFGSASELSF